MQRIFSQIISKFKLPKYIWFIILRVAGLRYYFGAEVAEYDIIKGSAEAGNLNLFKKFYKPGSYSLHDACLNGNKKIIKGMAELSEYIDLEDYCDITNKKIIKCLDKIFQRKNYFDPQVYQKCYNGCVFHGNLAGVKYYSNKKHVFMMEVPVLKFLAKSNNYVIIDYIRDSVMENYFAKKLCYYAIQKKNYELIKYCLNNGG